MRVSRQGQPQALDRPAETEVVTRFVAEEIAFLARTADPFGIDDPCEFNPAGHMPIASCRDLVCPHCGKVFWQ